VHRYSYRAGARSSSKGGGELLCRADGGKIGSLSAEGSVGLVIDRRAVLWALGCLCALLSARRAP